MATNISVNGTVYSVPSAGETGWASSVSTYLIAVGSAFLSKSGGSFTLTANANFGATYGLISKYFTSYSSNPSTTGVIRLANNEGIGFRNAANGADLILKVNASNILEYNGNPITTLALGAADYVLRMNSAGTASEYAKLVDANIASGAAIAVNKLAALTASKAAATDASGFVSAATTSLTELNYLAGVTTPTGTGALVLATSPSFTTPSLGAATATSINSTTIPSSKTLVVTTDKLSVHAATTSAELAGVISDETGSGALVFGTSPFITTPTGIVKGDVGLGNVDNTSDATKNAATATLTNKTLTSPVINTPTGIVKGDVGLGNVDNTSDATKDAATATLTNKSITSPNINTQATVKAAGELRFNNAGDTFYTGFKGGNASANKIFTLPIADGAPSQVLKTDGSATLSWGEASGGGVRNYISNASFEDTTITGWATYADAAGTTPVDGTGGSPTSTVAYSAVTPLRQNGSMLFTKPASNRQGEGISYAFTIDLQDTGKPVTVSFDASMSSGYTGSSGTENLVVYIYDVTNATLITPCQINIAPGVSSFNCFFIASTSTSYRLIIHAATTGTVAYTAKFDNFYCGPQSVIQGAAVTDWVSYTPTGSWSTNTTYSAKYRQVGDSIVIQGLITLAGAPTAADLFVNLPTGLLVDTAKLTAGSGGDYPILGSAEIFDSGGIRYVGAVVYGSTSAVYILHSTSANNGIVNATSPVTFAINDRISFNFTAPISTWSSSVTMANRSVEEYASSTTGTWDAAAAAGNTVYGIAGSPISGSLAADRAKVVRFQTPIQPTDRIFLEIQQNNTVKQWVDINQTYAASLFTPTVQFGAQISDTNATDVTVTFRQFAAPGTTYNSTTGAQNWSAGSFSNWRLRKVSGGASVGFPVSSSNIIIATDTTPTSNSLYSGTYTVLHTGGTNVAAAYNGVGKYIRVGNIVYVSGRVQLDLTATGDFITYFSLPIASNFTDADDAFGGYGVQQSSANAWMSADTANDRLQLNGTLGTASNSNITFHAMYIIK